METSFYITVPLPCN